jgi:hypothetical protein
MRRLRERGVLTSSSELLAGRFLSSGATLGLIGSVPTSLFPFFWSPFSVLTSTSFGLVLLCRVALLEKISHRLLIATATICFAASGGILSLYTLFGALIWRSAIEVALSSARVLGMFLALMGGAIMYTRARTGPPSIR